MEPLISIIVPVYQVEAYLDRCMESLLAQTYENLEIILVDDGSVDRCPIICDSYAEKDRRVHVIHQKNAGLSGARNAGIEAADGEYLAFVDPDDYVSRDFIRTLYELLEKTECAISQCRFAYVQGEPLRGTKDRDYHVYRGESLMEQLYGAEEEATCFVVAWNKLYRKELFAKIRYPLGRIHEDEATTYLLFHEGKKLAFTERILYGYYTENTKSITAVFSRKRLQWLTAQEERILFFRENGYDRLIPAAYRKLCDACITFYLRCTEEVEDRTALQKDLMESLKRYRIQGAIWIQKLPFRTRMGYRLFCVSPYFYEKLQKRIQGSV